MAQYVKSLEGRLVHRSQMNYRTHIEVTMISKFNHNTTMRRNMSTMRRNMSSHQSYARVIAQRCERNESARRRACERHAREVRVPDTETYQELSDDELGADQRNDPST